MRLDKRYARIAGGVVSAGVLAWVAVSNGTVQADPGGSGGDSGDNSEEPEPDPREGSELFLSSTEGAPGSKFTVGGRDCVEDEYGVSTYVDLTLEHEDGTPIDVAQGETDDEGNWEVTAVIPEDMGEGGISIDATCYLSEDDAPVLFAALQPQAQPLFSYASSSFSVKLPSTPGDGDGDGNGGDGGNGEGDGSGTGGPGGGTTGTGDGSGTGATSSSTATAPEPAPGVSGEADYTG